MNADKKANQVFIADTWLNHFKEKLSSTSGDSLGTLDHRRPASA